MKNKKKILIVDDEPDLMKITVFRLEKAGYEVLTASDGQAGLNLMKEMKPDLVLLDLNLPVMTGEKVCALAKADPAIKSIPLILLSASMEKIKELSERVTADGYIIKPFELSAFLAKIEEHLR